MSDENEEVLKVIGFFVLIPVLMILNGWALSVLWGWFGYPVFNVAISVTQAIGLSVIISYTHQISTIKKEYKDSVGSQILTGILKPFIMLGIGKLILIFI